MADPEALLRFLDATHGGSITLTLRQLGQIVGWAPTSGLWRTEDCSGPPGYPTPLLRSLTLALDAGWQLSPYPNDAAIVFTDRRHPPMAPAPIERRPRSGPPSIEEAIEALEGGFEWIWPAPPQPKPKRRGKLRAPALPTSGTTVH